jgi:hypothetical protein
MVCQSPPAAGVPIDTVHVDPAAPERRTSAAIIAGAAGRSTISVDAASGPLQASRHVVQLRLHRDVAGPEPRAADVDGQLERVREDEAEGQLSIERVTWRASVTSI